MAADLGKLFGRGSVAGQLIEWAVLQQVIGAVLAPELELLTREVNKLLQATPLTPEQLADMVVKGHVSETDAEAYAKESGLAPADFRRLVDDGGEPPGLEFLLQAFRRGFIERAGKGAESTSLEQGIRESRLKDKWIDLVERMRLVPIPVADAVDAVVEGQISYSEGEKIAYYGGVSADDFRVLFNTRGRPPSPVELVELVRRGFIPLQGSGPDVTSLQQGIFEGATKDKWEPAYEHLVEALPPPRTVTALLRAGTITDAQAMTWFQQSGLSQTAAQAYTDDAHHQKLAASKAVSLSLIEQLYHDQVISAQDATTYLTAERYTAQEIAWLLQVQDLKRAVTFLNGAIGRVHTLYVVHKIGKAAAVGALDALHVPPAQRDQLLATWDVERTANVKVLTEAQIAQAFFIGLIGQDAAIAELQNQGYQPFDAWLLLSLRMKKALPGRPAPPSSA